MQASSTPASAPVVPAPPPTNGPTAPVAEFSPDAGDEEDFADDRASDIIDAVGRNREAIVDIVRTVGSEFTKARDAHVHVNKHLSWLVFAFMALIVAGCGVLVYTGRMSDGSLTFLVGVIVGYMMRFVDRLNFGSGRAE